MSDTAELTDDQVWATETPKEPEAPLNGEMSDAEAFTPAPVQIAAKQKSAEWIGSAFGEGFREGTGGYEDLGLSEENQKAFRQSGLYKNTGVLGQAIFDQLVVPAASGLDAGMRTAAGAAITGPLYAGGQALEEHGVPDAKKAAGELGEYLLNTPALMDLHPQTQELVKDGQAHGVVGTSEAQFMGTEPLRPEQEIAQQVTTKPEPVEPPSIHDVARTIAPEAFTQFDRLSTSRDVLRSQLEALGEQRTTDLDAQIKDIQEAKQGGFGKLQSLIEKRDEIASQDTPEMAALREKLQQTDYAMRDLSPQVSDAYRQAQSQLPEAAGEGEEAPQHEAPAQPGKPIEEQRQYIVDDMKQKLSAVGRPQEEVDAISQLEAARYETLAQQYPKFSAEEWYSRESSNVVAGKERARVLAQKGELGQSGSPVYEEIARRLATEGDKAKTPRQWIKRVGDFVGRDAETAGDADALHSWLESVDKEDSKTRMSASDVAAFVNEKLERGELDQAQKGKIRLATEDSKATITLMKSADASTFIHEKGHEWADQLLRLAGENDAPAQLKADAETVRKYAGAGEDGSIPTRGHEKLARGFERYLMEGVAPSRQLAGVFAKFKQWLTAIYKAVDALRSPISDDIRDVFDRLLSASPEKTVLAPEHEAGKMMADIHEADAEHTPPEHAANVADNIRTEIKSVAKQDREAADVIAAVERGTGDSAGVEPAPADATPQKPPAVSASGGEAAPEGGTGETTGTAEPNAGGTVGAPEEGKPGPEPTNPNDTFPGSESNLVDKAGNIRLDNLNTPEDVNEVLRQTAKDNDNFMDARRGVISVGQQLDLADALGMDASQLNFRKIGQAFNAEQIIAARKLLVQSANTVIEAMRGEDVAAYAEAKTRHLMIQEHVAGITAEAGRALGAFRKLEGAQDAQALGEFLKENTGKDLFQLQEEMNFGKNLQTPAQVAKFLEASKKSSFKDMMLEYYINCLISGPVTHFRYSVGNAINALSTPLLEIPMQAAIGAIRGGEDRVYLGEAGAQLFALGKGSRDGLRAAADAFKTGVSPLLPGERESSNFADVKVNAIPGKVGEAINLPSRSVSAIHSFFKSIRYEQNIQGLAYRTAMKEGLEGQPFENRVADLARSPTEDMMKDATSGALKELYMAPTEYSSTMGALNRAINSNMLAKIIVPFMKIGSQITRNAFVERTPLGLLDKEVRGNILGGGAGMDQQLGKMAFGTALMGTTALMVAEGNATGDGPNDPSQRAIWMLNHRPNSIKIGDITIPYQGLGHLGMLMRFSANMTETARGWGEEDGGKLATSFLEGISKSVLDENFMRGIKDLLDAVYHPEEYGTNYVKQFVTNWLPFSVGAGQVARMVDPYQRDTKSRDIADGIMKAARDKIPVESESLMPRRDRFGEPIPNGAPLPRYQNDPVVQQMEALQLGVGQLDRKIRNVPLSDQQYDDYSRIAGQMTKLRLDAIVGQPEFSDLPNATQAEVIHKAIAASRETARSIIMMQNPDIIRKAVELKKSAVK